jgi:uncharacterized membrane protein
VEFGERLRAPGLKASFRREPVVELVIRRETALLGEEVGGHGNAVAPLLRAFDSAARETLRRGFRSLSFA